MEAVPFLILCFIVAGALISGLIAMLYLSKTRQDNLVEASEEIFDEDEPLGLLTDQFPKRNKN